VIILTAGNSRFKKMIKTSIKQSKKLGYTPSVYDLGGLGFGKPFGVENALFHEKGYYWNVKGVIGRKTRGFHKMSIIKDFLENNSEFTVYLDGDAILVDKIDEVKGDYDIGLTVRPQEEVEEVRRACGGTKDILDGYINAGVIFFNYTEGALRFIDIWEKEAQRLRNDQKGLNSLLKNFFPLEANKFINLEGVKIRTFDTRTYNCYYFDVSKSLLPFSKSEYAKKAKILHFKSDMRFFYYRYFRRFLYMRRKILSFLRNL